MSESVWDEMMNTANSHPILCDLAFGPDEETTTVTVTLAAPAYDPLKNAYYCLTSIQGIEGEGVEKVYYSDAFGALMLSLMRFRVVFERLDKELFTAQGARPHMYFPKEIPWVYGSDVYARLCAMVDTEVQKIEDDLTRRREADPDWNEDD